KLQVVQEVHPHCPPSVIQFHRTLAIAFSEPPEWRTDAPTQGKLPSLLRLYNSLTTTIYYTVILMHSRPSSLLEQCSYVTLSDYPGRAGTPGLEFVPAGHAFENSSLQSFC